MYRCLPSLGQAILDAARVLFVGEGYRNVSIRKIAAPAAGYRPAASVPKCAS